MKKARHIKIRELVENLDIETQEELVGLLEKEGFPVTQATISRDIRELKLTKISKSGGGQKYAILKESEHYLSDKYLRVLKDGFLSMDTAQNMLVVRTVPGMAMAVAASIDAMRFKEIVGTIAGDDTIMMALKTAGDAAKVKEEIRAAIED
ncbi:MAG: arginine repressor [Lachnospiraceae bacterium]|nr:arginine repressor [Lachnospiraceae bacterium]